MNSWYLTKIMKLVCQCEANLFSHQLMIIYNLNHVIDVVEKIETLAVFQVKDITREKEL